MELQIGTLYDANKQIIKTMNEINDSQYKKILSELENWFNNIIDTYAMLLCHEQRDYTIFHLYENQNPNPPAVAAVECLECLKNRGKLVSADLQTDGAWEFWIVINEEAYAYYLFKYDDAVIEC